MDAGTVNLPAAGPLSGGAAARPYSCRGVSVRTVPLPSQVFLTRINEIPAVYGRAGGHTGTVLARRRAFMASHTTRPDFLAVGTLDAQDRLLGFGYGYASEPGQFWHNEVRAALPPPLRATWLSDSYEVVELHVDSAAQGRGIGAAQLRLLLAAVTTPYAILSTLEAPETASRAWRLYRRFGFVDLVRDLRFTGDPRPFGILGRALPLT